MYLLMRFWFWLIRSKYCGERPPAVAYRAGANECRQKEPHTIHNDDNGFLWNDTHWTWQGPTVRLEDEFTL